MTTAEEIWDKAIEPIIRAAVLEDRKSRKLAARESPTMTSKEFDRAADVYGKIIAETGKGGSKSQLEIINAALNAEYKRGVMEERESIKKQILDTLQEGTPGNNWLWQTAIVQLIDERPQP